MTALATTTASATMTASATTTASALTPRPRRTPLWVLASHSGTGVQNVREGQNIKWLGSCINTISALVRNVFMREPSHSDIQFQSPNGIDFR
jgi:hypothetical protein